MGRRRKFGFSFSAKRALGITSLKQKIARTTGIPTTRAGRQRKFGALLGGGLFGLFTGGIGRSRRRSSSAGTSMASNYVHCPQCGVKYNIREQSIGTFRRCDNCGFKFVISAPPYPPQQPTTSLAGCLGGLLTVVIGGAVVVFGCCGIAGVIGSLGPTTVEPSSPRAIPPVVTPAPTRQIPISQAPQPPVETAEPATAEPYVEASPIPEPIVDETPVTPDTKLRTWTSADGRFSVSAEYLYTVKGKVKLKKADGTTTLVPLAKLSEDDRAWLDLTGHRGDSAGIE